MRSSTPMKSRGTAKEAAKVAPVVETAPKENDFLLDGNPPMKFTSDAYNDFVGS